LSPDERPFPRKEMVWAQWGLRDKLRGDVDIWLCHQCTDCSSYCPRGAKPGDVLAAIRNYTFIRNAFPRFLGEALSQPRFLPVLFAIPLVLFLLLLAVTGHWNIPPGEVVFSKFFPIKFVDSIFITLTVLVAIAFGMGVSRFLTELHEYALREKLTGRENIVPSEFVSCLISMIPEILKHSRFKECGVSKDRYLAHILVLFGFLGLFIVTGVVFLGLYLLGVETPYHLLNPIKIFANVAAISLFVGIILVLINRLAAKNNGTSNPSYHDWLLIAVILGLVTTGILSELTRLAQIAALAYPTYLVHLVFVFFLIGYLPYSKLAHLVYRTLALAYARYIERETKQA